MTPQLWSAPIWADCGLGNNGISADIDLYRLADQIGIVGRSSGHAEQGGATAHRRGDNRAGERAAQAYRRRRSVSIKAVPEAADIADRVSRLNLKGVRDAILQLGPLIEPWGRAAHRRAVPRQWARAHQ